MSLRTTIGQVLVNDALPPEFRDYTRRLDKPGIKALYDELARKQPEKYADVSRALLQVAREVSFLTGGQSFGLDSLRTSPVAMRARARLRTAIDKILHAGLPPEEQDRAIVEATAKERDRLAKEVLAAAKADDPLAGQVLSGARGNPSQYARLVAGDLLYLDQDDEPIAAPAMHSFAEGLDPTEWFSSAFGARKGLVETKLAVADAGFFCLARGTAVRMADGRSRPIEQIEPGDMVLGATAAGEAVAVKVLKRFNCGTNDVHAYRYESASGDGGFVLQATEWHRVLIVNKKRLRHQLALGLCSIGTPIVTIYGSGSSWRDSEDFVLTGVEHVGMLQTFDLEVDHPDHLYVLANGAVVSNSKQLNQATHRLLTVADDDDDEPKTLRGLPVATSDMDSAGALLAQQVGPYKRNTVLTPKILHDLQDRGIKRILVRSPLVGGPASGVYSRDVGVRETGHLPGHGDMVGLTAAAAIAERLTQMKLSSKHFGGKVKTGFDTANQLVQVPKSYAGGAAHAQLDGRVTKITPNPAGGTIVTIGYRMHYVPANADVRVKVGDEVEAGDVISDGLPNPAEIVKHKGIGEGRRYFTELFRDVVKGANRRNVELIARGLIDHVEFTDPVGNHMPGAIASYNQLERHWKPRPGTETLAPKRAIGRYLEQPVLHYSVGDRITPSMVKQLAEFNVPAVAAHRDPPPFRPVMIRAMAIAQNDQDWLARMLGSGQKRGLLDAVHTGASSDLAGTSFVPPMVMGAKLGKDWPVVSKPSKPKLDKPTRFRFR